MATFATNSFAAVKNVFAQIREAAKRDACPCWTEYLRETRD